MLRLKSGVAGLIGWRRHLTAVLLGALAAAALAPVHALPVVLVSFSALLWMIAASRNGRAAFAAGWWFGFGYFVAGLYWTAIAMLSEPERFAWMVPFAVLGLPAILASFPGLAALATWMVGCRSWGRVLALALAWTAAEWVRGQVLSGFPWNLIGYVWSAWPEMTQLAAVTGVYGLSFVTVALAALPACFAEPAPGPRGRFALAAAGLAVLGVLWGGGTMRLAGAALEAEPGVRLRIVQPNIRQPHKWRDDLRAAQFATYLRMSSSAGLDRVTHLIWPETALPFYLSREPALARLLGGLLKPNGLLLTGAPRVESGVARPRRIWNSVHVIDANGRLVATYDKFHLVPFGEYLPLRRLLRWFGAEKITPGALDFSAGRGPQTLALPGLPPVGPLICYEAIFPGRVVARGDRPAWLLNVTNDGWFGISSGPHQHFAMARMRAVEEGLPLVRAANTGISAVVDPFGRIVARLGLGRAGVLDSALPRALPAPPPYGRYGDPVPAVAGLAVILLILGSRRLWQGSERTN